MVSLICNRNRFDPTFRTIMAGELINKEFGDEIILITSKKYKYFNQIYKNFGIENHKYVNVQKFIYDNFIKSIYYFFQSLKDILVYSFSDIESFFYKYKIKNINIGKLIYEDIHRFNFKFTGKKKLISFNFFKKILTSYILIDILEKLIREKKIRYLIMSDSYTYVSPNSIIFQLAKKLNIKTILLNQENIRLFKKKKDFDKIYKSLDQLNLNESASSKEVNNYLSKRFKGIVKENIFKKSFYKKTKVKKNFIKKFFHLQNSNYRKKILFCPHAFTDTAQAKGKFIFMDYYEFFCESIKQMSKIGDILWLVKLHPHRFRYEQEIGVGEKFIKKINRKNILICPDRFHSLSIAKEVDGIVTGRGTITLEAASIGREVLAYEFGQFQNLNFITKYKSKKDYFKKLKFNHQPPKIDEKKKFLAKKAMFIMNKSLNTTHDKIFSNIKHSQYHSNLYTSELNSKNVKENIYWKSYLNPIIRSFSGDLKKVYSSYYYKKLKKEII